MRRGKLPSPLSRYNLSSNFHHKDYYATIYSAELVNTSTNLIFVYLAWKGISSCIRYHHPRVFLIGFLGYLSIAIGSMCFHSSLKCHSPPLHQRPSKKLTLTDPMQLLDELAMIYTTCIMVYALFSRRQSALVCTALSVILLSLAVFITAYYHYLQDPKFHQNMFALLTALVTFRSMWLMEFCLRPSRRPKGRDATSIDVAEQARIDHRDKQILKTMWGMYGYGLSFFGIGFCIWKMDTVFCGTLRGWRREIGLPWGILLEGHGWW